jgi:hypothetical protein
MGIELEHRGSSLPTGQKELKDRNRQIDQSTIRTSQGTAEWWEGSVPATNQTRPSRHLPSDDGATRGI